MTGTADAIAVAAAEAGGRPCVRCGYDLRGIAGDAEASSGAGGSGAGDARCPECGLTAYWSLRAPARLSEYPPGWVTAMARAARLLAGAYGVAFATLLLGASDLLPHRRVEVVLAAGLLVAALLQCAGAWLLARRSRHPAEPRMPLTRAVLWLAPAAALAAAGGGLLLTERYDGDVVTWVIAAACAGALGPVAVFVRLRAVARMIADAGLAEHCAIVAWGVLLTTAAAGTIIYVVEHHRRSTGDLATLLMLLAVAVATLLFLLWGAAVMGSCVADFNRAARIARAAWAADAPPA